MASHEKPSETDEWYTPAWLFEALNVKFFFDPCSPIGGSWPCHKWCRYGQTNNGLEGDWMKGPVWLNPPFGGRNEIRPWLEKLADHGNGIAIVPNRTGTEWFQYIASQADARLFVYGKIKFLRPDGSEGKSPGYGNVLLAFGKEMAIALLASEIHGLRA